MNSPSLIRVTIRGGSTIDQAGLAVLIAGFPGIDVLASNSEDTPTVMVWDAGYKLSNLPTPQPQSYLLVLTNKTDIETFPPGIAGLFSKEEPPEALAAAIRQVARGQQYLSPALAVSILQHSGPNYLPNTLDQKKLSEREREILKLLSQGLSNKTIASRLYISVRTVEGHLDKLYTHLGVHSRIEAVILAMQQAKNR
ncbi:MAG TPA: response regulator transcription factor [Bacteroidales bacterium]|nr:response regulator transcription factor [Bacteroidales bacterium]